MALINCYECKTEISTAAAACPKCGAPPKNVQQPQQAPAKPKTRPIFKFLAVMLVVLFIFAKLSTSNKPGSASTETGTAAQSPAIPVSAATLSRDYKANEVAADIKYKGKRLRLTGTVASINKDFTDSVWIGIETDNQFMPIHAEGFVPSQVADLQKGSQIEITCTGAGMVVGDPFLKHCS